MRQFRVIDNEGKCSNWINIDRVITIAAMQKFAEDANLHSSSWQIEYREI